MKDVTIEDYIGMRQVMTAEEVRELPIGERVELHSFDRYGNHQWAEYTIVKSGKKKMLLAHIPGTWEPVTKPINKLPEGRKCYTTTERR